MRSPRPPRPETRTRLPVLPPVPRRSPHRCGSPENRGTIHPTGPRKQGPVLSPTPATPGQPTTAHRPRPASACLRSMSRATVMSDAGSSPRLQRPAWPSATDATAPKQPGPPDPAQRQPTSRSSCGPQRRRPRLSLSAPQWPPTATATRPPLHPQVPKPPTTGERPPGRTSRPAGLNQSPPEATRPASPAETTTTLAEATPAPCSSPPQVQGLRSYPYRPRPPLPMTTPES